MHRLYTVPQAAELLAVSRATAYRMIARGDLKVVRIGRSVRIPEAELAAFVERLCQQSEETEGGSA